MIPAQPGELRCPQNPGPRTPSLESEGGRMRRDMEPLEAGAWETPRPTFLDQEDEVKDLSSKAPNLL